MENATPRLFVRDRLEAGRTITVEGPYLGRVLRMRAGDAVRLFNGIDGEWRARIACFGKRDTVLAAERLLRPQTPEPGPWLAFAPLRRDATELVVQKATELGAAVIQPVLTARTNPTRLHPERLEAIAIEAAEQSERLTVPEIRPPLTLPAFLAEWPPERQLAVAVERAEWPGLGPGAGGLLIGPEGGFAPAELDLLNDKPFIQRVSLGPRILRAETASIAGLALLGACRPEA